MVFSLIHQYLNNLLHITSKSLLRESLDEHLLDLLVLPEDILTIDDSFLDNGDMLLNPFDENPQMFLVFLSFKTGLLSLLVEAGSFQDLAEKIAD
jgi:hypothetical protein